jgi:ribosomal protein L37AE/L43A
MARAAERDRYKYGVCTNRDKDGKPCPKCESKEVQKIRMGQDFVCEECKESMRQVPPPKQSAPLGKIIGIVVAVVIILGGAASYFFIFKKNDSLEPAIVTGGPEIIDEPALVINVDSVSGTEVSEPPKSEPGEDKSIKANPKTDPVDVAVTKTTISVKGGSYTGQEKGGKPHGQGTLTYNSRTRISMRDMKERYAEAGQYVIGEFYEGELVQGKLFDTNNDPIESIIVGRPR